MKAFRVNYTCIGDWVHDVCVVADSPEKAKAKVVAKRATLGRVEGQVFGARVTEMQDKVTYNYRGTEMSTGVVLSGKWTGNEGEKQAKRDAKYMGKIFKSDNPQLFKKGQRVNLKIDLFVADSRVTVQEIIEDWEQGASVEVIR